MRTELMLQPCLITAFEIQRLCGTVQGTNACAVTSLEGPCCKLEKGKQIWRKFKLKKKERAEDDVDFMTAKSVVGEYDGRRKRMKPNRPDAAAMDFSLEWALGDILSSYEDELKRLGTFLKMTEMTAALKRTRPPVMLFQRHRLRQRLRHHLRRLPCLLQLPIHTLHLHRRHGHE